MSRPVTARRAAEAERRSTYRDEHAAELAGRQRQYRAAHLEEEATRMRKYRAEHPDARRAHDRKYRAEHAEEIAEYGRKYYVEHREEHAEWGRKYRAEHSRRDRGSVLRRLYGIDVHEWDELLASQGGCCAVCGRDQPSGRGWATDHDHDTGKVRGILCFGCNTGLGSFSDNPARLRAAAEYLEAVT